MATASTALDTKISRSPGRIGMIVFGIVLVIGFAYAGSHLLGDLSAMHSTSALPFVLLGVALLVALGFEFVNGFHDTANAVATVIYTHSLEPHVAVVWSGFWNFLGVMASSGLVAFGIISLLSGGAHSAGRQQGWLCHGVCATRGCYHMEPRYMVFRPSGF
jgi:PiT family inorganic phosphate transporter